MPDLDEALQEYLDSVKAIANMSMADQAKITGAGAKVMAEELHNATAIAHPSQGKGGKFGHLADDIDSKATNIDGMKDGTSIAGFGEKAFVARFLNDGTKYIQGDHFVEDARDAAQEKVLQAEAEEYRKLLEKRGR